MKLFLFGLLITLSSLSFSQDILTTRNGDEIKTKILEVLPDLIKYKKWENIDGPTYSISKSEVFMIKYQNGTKDVFKEEIKTKVESTSNPSGSNSGAEASSTVQRYFENRVKNESKGTMAFYNFKKINGQETNFGAKGYVVDYKVQIQALATGYLPHENMTAEIYKFILLESPTKKQGWFDDMTGEKFITKGQIVEISGTANCALTDNGWKVSKTDNSRFTVLGAAEVKYPSTVESTQIKNPNTVEPPPFEVQQKFLKTDIGTFLIRFTDVKIRDDLNNLVETQNNAVKNFFNMGRLVWMNPTTEQLLDTLDLSLFAEFSYRNYSSNNSSTYFADCILHLKLTSKKGTQHNYTNQYKLSNYQLLSKGFVNYLEANRDIISKHFDQALNQFIIGNFPLTGEITEITSKNKKPDEAKTVKINIGKNSGILAGYRFMIPEYNSGKEDLIVDEVFENYSICKVLQNDKRILADINSGKKILIKTIYKP